MSSRETFRTTAPVGAALLLLTAPSAAQTSAYINLLQFDLQSYRSQATGGIFLDDIDILGNASRLMEIDGNRLYTNFSNLADAATLGDAIITYDATPPGAEEHPSHLGNTTSFDRFDTGTFLTGWVGKYSIESEYVLEAFFQRSGSKAMFENLEDGVVGNDFPLPTYGPPTLEFPGFVSSSDASFRGTVVSSTHDPITGDLTGDTTVTVDLERYDERTAKNYDFGVARSISQKLDVGGRFFYEKDQLDRHLGGVNETRTRVLSGPVLQETRTLTTYSGTGEEAFKYREIGMSLNLDYHPWATQSLNLRLDLSRNDLANPSTGLLTSPTTRGIEEEEYEDPVGEDVDATETVTRTRVGGGFAGGIGTLTQERENVTRDLSPRLDSSGMPGPGALAITSIVDERSGIGISMLAEYDREWGGGDTRTWFGYARRPFDLDATRVRRSLRQSELWWNDGGVDDTLSSGLQWDDTEVVTRVGDMTHAALEGGIRYSRELSERVNVGLGFILTSSKWKEEYRQRVELTEHSRFDDGATGSNALFSFTADPAHIEFDSTVTSVSEAEIDDEVRNTTTRLPVGTQFRFGDWTWNMGLTHAIIHSSRETKESVPADAGGQTRTRVIDASGVETVSVGTSAAHGSRTIEDKNSWNQTTYWYGLEWLLSDSAQININGFFDTHEKGNAGNETQVLDVAFFQNLAISITFLFD